MGMAFLPIYIKYLGMEAYGLVGIYVLLQSWFMLLDMGITPTLSREMARYLGGGHTAQSIRDLLRSLEVLLVFVAFSVFLFFYFFSDWIANNWLSASKLSTITITQSIQVIGIVISLRFLEGLYRSAIVGLQDQVWLNLFLSFVASMRSFGAVLILFYISSDIRTFFIWQAFCSTLSVIGLLVRLCSILPVSENPAQFSLCGLKEVWKFASGMIATTFLSLMLTHADKLLLSNLLSLEDFGKYSLAWAVGNTILILVSPIAQSYGPKFTEIIASGKEKELVFIYHQGSQLMTLMVLPAALILIFFSRELLTIWTGDIALSANISPLVSIIALGTTFNALMNLPFLLQLSYGYSSFAAKVNLIELILLIPGLYFMVPKYGVIAAAFIWLLINASYILVVLHVMHRFILKGEKFNWYFNDFLYPTIPVLLTIVFFKQILPFYENRLVEFILLLGVGITSFFICLFASPLIKRPLVEFIRRSLTRHG